MLKQALGTIVAVALAAGFCAQAQAQGALDLAIFYAKKGDYKPESEIWAKYPDMPWHDGKDKIYNVPWTPVTSANVDALLAERSK